jgi:soluble P-type ATPase
MNVCFEKYLLTLCSSSCTQCSVQIHLGEFAGFDENEPTSRNNGKGEVIKLLKKKHGYSSVVLIGDGATDLEASPPADAFIGKYT